MAVSLLGRLPFFLRFQRYLYNFLPFKGLARNPKGGLSIMAGYFYGSLPIFFIQIPKILKSKNVEVAFGRL